VKAATSAASDPVTISDGITAVNACDPSSILRRTPAAVQEALAGASAPDLAQPSVDGDSPDALKAEADALDSLAERGYYNEKLDQIVVDVLLGTR
jgi:hypothetical protein